MIHFSRKALASALVAAAALSSAFAQAQDYPHKPITIVAPFAAGSGTDQMARAYGQVLSETYKVPVIVENKAGASGFLAAQYVANAAPDGYTVLLTTNTTHAANEHLFKKLPYDPVKDFTPVSLIATGNMFLLVNASSDIKSVSDLVAAAKKTPGKLNFGSGSSSSRVGSELLKQMTQIDVLHIPYKSNPMAIADLLGGQIDFMFVDAPTALPQIASGKVRALAVSSTERMAAAPDVPTVAQAGVKGYDVSYWIAFYLPANASKDITSKLNQMIVKASHSPLIEARMAATSSVSKTSTPDELAQFQAAESGKWGTVIRAAGIQPD